MQRTRKFLFVCAFLILTLYGIFYGGWKVFEYYWYKKFIPEKIQVSYPVHIHSELAGFAEGCGAAIYRLSDQSAQAITHQGVQFLGTKWEETPVTEETETSGLLGLSCSTAPDTLKQQIYSAIKNQGSYYTYWREEILVVIPDQKLVVFALFG